MEFHIFTVYYLMNFWQRIVENFGMYSWLLFDFALGNLLM